MIQRPVGLSGVVTEVVRAWRVFVGLGLSTNNLWIFAPAGLRESHSGTCGAVVHWAFHGDPDKAAVAIDLCGGHGCSNAGLPAVCTHLRS